ncbi:2-C-methyl-D-erythritol 4-phosphate cytidylyltransferase [Flavobacteriales bacterium]|nr:2-C-methyl-D-erythritol 4-phosphate cytidylyltransferase [Flavobacteriales bacterium]
MKRYAIIVAGGSGQRMKSSIPKQFMELLGRPVLMHTIEKFYSANASIEQIVVLPSSHHSTWATLCRKHQFQIPHQIASGGKSRFESVKNGLEHCTDASIIAVHDGVRPLISSDLITKIYVLAEQNKAVIPACPVSESIRRVSDDSSKSLDRSQYYLVQTPQCFSSELIQAAYEQEERDAFTDDASVVEALGAKVYLCEGETTNIKLTSPEDLSLAEVLMTR